MSEEAKIHLSALELELVNNTKWIFTKQIIIKKVYHLFGKLSDDYKKILEEGKDSLPDAIRKGGSKITKGENFKGLPYLVLDFPATFSKENVFAIRTMFWWGNFFSITLHLSGKYYKQRIDFSESIIFLKKKGFFVCVNKAEWEHDFLPNNYINAGKLKQKDTKNIRKKNFFKIAKKIELTQWEHVPLFLNQAFKEIIEFIKISYPAGEKVL